MSDENRYRRSTRSNPETDVYTAMNKFISQPTNVLKNNKNSRFSNSDHQPESLVCIKSAKKLNSNDVDISLSNNSDSDNEQCNIKKHQSKSSDSTNTCIF